MEMETAFLANKIGASPGAWISKPLRTYKHMWCKNFLQRHENVACQGSRNVCAGGCVTHACGGDMDSGEGQWCCCGRRCMCLAAGQQQQRSTQTTIWWTVRRSLAYNIYRQQQQGCMKATPVKLLRFHFGFLQISIKSKIFTFRNAHFSRANPPGPSARTTYICVCVASRAK